MSNCRACKHYRETQQSGGEPICRAFPSGIPHRLWFDQEDHFDPIPGDNGFQFLSDMDEEGSVFFTRKVRALQESTTNASDHGPA